MKGIIIYENDLGSINAVKLKHASFCCKSIEMDITDTLEGTPIKCESANCNKDDTYDFETGALIALMKMCGVDKIVRACNEAFSEDTFKIYAIKYERELNELKKDFDKVRDLKEWIAQPIWQKEVFKQIHKDQLASLLEAGKYLYKIPTKREEMWEKIFELHKESDVIIKVKREDIITFLHEIENKIPEITWASGVKIFEAKYTIKDIFNENEICDTPYEIYFRLWKVNKLSYSSDPDIYQHKDLHHIDYLPPMRWDLFKKGRLAVKVNYDNYKEFYEACERELGKKPSTMYTGEYTVSICKKDGYFEIFTIEHQKKTGRKIVNWEDVR